MNENTHLEDADKLINFFVNIENQYLNFGKEKGLISFCLQVLNVESFDIKQIESALCDLRSITMVISRNIDEVKQVEFNSVVKTGIDKIDMWLHGVYNHKIDFRDENVFFSDSNEVSSYLSKASKKVLRDDYFNLISAGNGVFNPNIVRTTIRDDGQESMETNLITVHEGVCYYGQNETPWTDRNRIWIGNEKNLNELLEAKYRKAHDKRLVAIIKNAYELLGSKLLFRCIDVEEDALKSEKSYACKFNSDDSYVALTIQKKEK